MDTTQLRAEAARLADINSSLVSEWLNLDRKGRDAARADVFESVRANSHAAAKLTQQADWHERATLVAHPTQPAWSN